jgi:hypothetical protein
MSDFLSDPMSDRKKKVFANSVIPNVWYNSYLRFCTKGIDQFSILFLISPLVFIEVKVIKFSVFSVVQNCICYVFYSVCLEFCCFDDMTDNFSASFGKSVTLTIPCMCSFFLGVRCGFPLKRNTISLSKEYDSDYSDDDDDDNEMDELSVDQMIFLLF